MELLFRIKIGQIIPVKGIIINWEHISKQNLTKLIFKFREEENVIFNKYKKYNKLNVDLKSLKCEELNENKKKQHF